MRTPLLAVALFAAASFLPLLAVEKPAPVEPAPAKVAKPYPLDTCVVSGDKLGADMGDAVVYDHEGREVRFCCKGCIDDFKKDPATYLAKLDAAESAAAKSATAPGAAAKPGTDAKVDAPKAAPVPAPAGH